MTGRQSGSRMGQAPGVCDFVGGRWGSRGGRSRCFLERLGSVVTRVPWLKEDANGCVRFWIERPVTPLGRAGLGAAVVVGWVRLQLVNGRSAAVVALREAARCGLGVYRRRRWVPSSKSLDATVAGPSLRLSAIVNLTRRCVPVFASSRQCAASVRCRLCSREELLGRGAASGRWWYRGRRVGVKSVV